MSFGSALVCRSALVYSFGIWGCGGSLAGSVCQLPAVGRESRLGVFVPFFRSSLPPGVVFGLFGLVPVGAARLWFGSGLAGRPWLLGVCRCSALLPRPSSLLVSPCSFKSLAFELVLCTGASPPFARDWSASV